MKNLHLMKFDVGRHAIQSNGMHSGNGRSNFNTLAKSRWRAAEAEAATVFSLRVDGEDDFCGWWLYGVLNDDKLWVLWRMPDVWWGDSRITSNGHFCPINELQSQHMYLYTRNNFSDANFLFIFYLISFFSNSFVYVI